MHLFILTGVPFWMIHYVILLSLNPQSQNCIMYSSIGLPSHSIIAPNISQFNYTFQFFVNLCYELHHGPPNLYVKTLILNVGVFRDSIFKAVIKASDVIRMEPLIQCHSFPYEKRKRPGDAHAQGKDQMRHSDKAAITS